MKTHAPQGGIVGENDRFYPGGEFVPVYKPRPLMPQVNDTAYPALLSFLSDNGIACSRETVPWQALHARQRIDRDKAARIPASVLAIPLLVSADGAILDGNHRWLAHKMAGEACKVLRVELAFDDAIAALFFFLQQSPDATLTKELTTG